MYLFMIFVILECKFHTCVEYTHLRIILVRLVICLRVHVLQSGESQKVIAGDIDRMEELGIYEVAPEDFALCEFVCSSKMELQRIVREGLDMLRREMC